MNNTLCLGLFLLVMHIQRLPWTYSSEVLVTVGARLFSLSEPIYVVVKILGSMGKRAPLLWESLLTL